MKILFYVLSITLISLGTFASEVPEFTTSILIPENQNLDIPFPEIVEQRVDESDNLIKVWDQKNPIAVENNHYRFGRYLKEYWIKFSYKSTPRDLMLLINSRQIEFAEMSTFLNGKKVDYGYGGLRSGDVGLNLLTRHPVFFLRGIKEPGQVDVIIRVRSLAADDVWFQINSYGVILQEMEMGRALIYFFLGAVLILCAYLIVLHSGIGEHSLYYYLAFVVSFTLTNVFATGLVDYFIHPDSTFKFAYVSAIFSSITGFFAAAFTLHFLAVSQFSRKLLGFGQVISIANLILAIGYFMMPEDSAIFFNQTQKILQIGTIGLIILAVIVSSVNRVKYSRLILLSWLPLSIFLIFDIFRALPLHKAFGGQLLQIPLLAEMLIMSVAMAIRVKEFREQITSAAATQKQNSLMRILVRAVSHDLANHFFIVTAHSHQLLKEITDEKSKKRVMRIDQAMQQAKGIISSIRAWVLADDGNLRVDLKPLSVNQLLKNSISIFHERAQEKEINIQFTKAESEDFISCDETAAINQVFGNVLSNAIKFSPRGGQVLISINSDDKSVKVSIQDFGVGMSSEVLALVCQGESINSTLGTENEKGTGFGWPLMFSYMNAFGGKIKVQSSNVQGQSGTTVELTFQKASSKKTLNAA